MDEVGKQTLVDGQIAFVFSAIAEVMTSGKHPPHLRTEAKGVRKHLKHDVPVRGSIPRAAQRGEAQRVCGVVGEIESTLQGIGLFLRIGESSAAGLLKPGALLRVRRLLAQ